MIEYRKGDLFNAPAEAILAHACNAQGVWGAGVAAQFRKRFPNEFLLYEAHCELFSDDAYLIVGECFMAGRVACLITSKGFGWNVDTVDNILEATRDALEDLVYEASCRGVEIHMPKINSGLFGVPWEKTEQVLKEVLARKFTKTNDWVPKVVVWEL